MTFGNHGNKNSREILRSIKKSFKLERLLKRETLFDETVF